MSVEIRAETAADKSAVFELYTAAFPTQAEAKLVDALRATASPYIALVAVEDVSVVGHIMFTPVTLETYDELRLMGLAPMAVAPQRQRRGIGTALVHAGLAKCREQEAAAVVVLGHADYYPRFGFRPASRWGIGSEYDVPDDVFMLLELSPGCLRGFAGTIRYNAAFADA